jgi:hypothetical protein
LVAIASGYPVSLLLLGLADDGNGIELDVLSEDGFAHDGLEHRRRPDEKKFLVSSVVPCCEEQTTIAS